MIMKKIKALLVYPTTSETTSLTPLSQAIFAWILKKEECETRLFITTHYDLDPEDPDTRYNNLQYRPTAADAPRDKLPDETQMLLDFEAQIETFKPDILLFSCTEDAVKRALTMLRVSNKFNIPTVLGGIVAISDPEWIISFPEISMVCISEGEPVIKELVNRIRRGSSFDGIPSLWIKNTDGSIQRNPMGQFVDVNDYSTDFSIYSDETFVRPMGGKIFRAAPIQTFRGCPNRCTYCNSPMHNTIAKEHGMVFLRRRTIENTRQEIKHLIEDHGINFLFIADDDFMARPKSEMLAFCDMYEEFKIPFWFNTRVEHVDLDVMVRLKEVGAYRISFGIESGNEEFRKKNLLRSASNQKLIDQFAIVTQSGIPYSVNVIIGYPYETRDMVFDGIRLIKQIEGYDSVSIGVFTPYRGTALREVALKEGWLDPNIFLSHLGSLNSSLNMPQFSQSEIRGLLKTFILYTFFDESHWPEIEKIEKNHPDAEQIYQKYAALYRKMKWGIE